MMSFKEAMLEVILFHGEGNRAKAKEWLGRAALVARSEDELNKLADFCKKHGY